MPTRCEVGDGEEHACIHVARAAGRPAIGLALALASPPPRARSRARTSHTAPTNPDRGGTENPMSSGQVAPYSTSTSGRAPQPPPPSRPRAAAAAAAAAAATTTTRHGATLRKRGRRRATARRSNPLRKRGRRRATARRVLSQGAGLCVERRRRRAYQRPFTCCRELKLRGLDERRRTERGWRRSTAMRRASKAPRTQSHTSSVRWSYTRSSGASARSVARSRLAVAAAP